MSCLSNIGIPTIDAVAASLLPVARRDAIRRNDGRDVVAPDTQSAIEQE